MSEKLFKAIKSLRPDAEFSYTANDYATIKWDILEGKAPTNSEIEKAIKDIEAAEQAKAKADTIAKAAVLDRLGITADEAALLLS